MARQRSRGELEAALRRETSEVLALHHFVRALKPAPGLHFVTGPRQVHAWIITVDVETGACHVADVASIGREETRAYESALYQQWGGGRANEGDNGEEHPSYAPTMAAWRAWRNDNRSWMEAFNG